MNGFDLVILIVVAVFAILGFYWGLIRQVLSLVGLVAGIAVAGRVGPEVAVALSSFIPDESVAAVLGFVLVLVAVSALASLLATLLRRFVGLLFLGWADHLAGAMLGTLQAGLACAIMLLALAAFPNELWMPGLAESRFAAPLVRGYSFILPALPSPFQMAAQTAFGAN